MVEIWVLILRLFLAVVLGFAVGLERRLRSKEAAIRTHIIVSVGACLFMIISKYGFADLSYERWDASRIASQVVTGIGFIGAGMILHKKNMIYGLTTAAGVWATAGIGMAVGAGMYIVSAVATAFIIIVQCLMHIKCWLFTNERKRIIRVVFIGEENTDKVKEIFKVKDFDGLSAKKTDKGIEITAIILNSEHLSEDYILLETMKTEAIVSVNYNTEGDQ